MLVYIQCNLRMRRNEISDDRSSYEVRSRLNPLIGFLQLLADDLLDDPDERSELINESYRSASHILESLEFIEDSVKLRIDRK